MWSTGKEWKIFLEDSHFVWFPTESTFCLHFNDGRIHLSGTELCDLKLKCDKLPLSVNAAETTTIYTVLQFHICIIAY